MYIFNCINEQGVNQSELLLLLLEGHVPDLLILKAVILLYELKRSLLDGRLYSCGIVNKSVLKSETWPCSFSYCVKLLINTIMSHLTNRIFRTNPFKCAGPCKNRFCLSHYSGQEHTVEEWKRFERSIRFYRR